MNNADKMARLEAALYELALERGYVGPEYGEAHHKRRELATRSPNLLRVADSVHAAADVGSPAEIQYYDNAGNVGAHFGVQANVDGNGWLWLNDRGRQVSARKGQWLGRNPLGQIVPVDPPLEVRS